MKTRRNHNSAAIVERNIMRHQRDEAISLLRQAFELITDKGKLLPHVGNAAIQKFAEDLSRKQGGAVELHIPFAKKMMKIIPGIDEIKAITEPLAELDQQRRALQRHLA